MNPVPPSRMNCDAFLAGLAEYLGGELDPAARAAAEGHVASCASCRSQSDALARAQAAVESLTPHAEHAEARTAALIMPEAPAVVFRFRRLARSLAIAAGLALAFVLGYAARGPSANAPWHTVQVATESGIAETYAKAARSAPATSSLTWGLMSIASR